MIETISWSLLTFQGLSTVMKAHTQEFNIGEFMNLDKGAVVITYDSKSIKFQMTCKVQIQNAVTGQFKVNIYKKAEVVKFRDSIKIYMIQKCILEMQDKST